MPPQDDTLVRRNGEMSQDKQNLEGSYFEQGSAQEVDSTVLGISYRIDGS